MKIPKYSIVIPTYNHCEDLLKPCIESIIKYTDMEQVEVVVVANGCADTTWAYFQAMQSCKWFVPIWFDEPLGYPRSTNIGIKAAKGEYIVLLNNDTELLRQPKNQWLERLVVPFANPKAGIIGPHPLRDNYTDEWFMVFWCVMIKRAVFDKLGLLDESFSPGGSEDIDFCIRAKRAGYELVNISTNQSADGGNTNLIGDFPIWHKGNQTLGQVPGYANLLHEHGLINQTRYKIMPAAKTKRVLCAIPTKDRYDMLMHCLQSVAMQTVRPDKVIIYDDSEQRVDIRAHPVGQYVLRMLNIRGIDWELVHTPGKGQFVAHQLANTSGYELVWRLDDDCIAAPDVLERLLGHLLDDSGGPTHRVGGVGGAVYDPMQPVKGGSGRIIDMFHAGNWQWGPDQGVHEVEHLYSSFLYRAGIVNYKLDMSPAAFREETIFSHRLHRAGYRLLVDTSIHTWHCKAARGGTRTAGEWNYTWDNAEFLRLMEREWKIKLIHLGNGLGDCIAFKSLLPDLCKKYDTILVGSCYNEVFKDEPQVYIIDYQAARANSKADVYAWMHERKWRGHIIDALKEIYT